MQNFSDACEFIESQGHQAINPLDVIPQCEEGCESGLQFSDGRYMHSWKCYMKADIIALLDCDAIFVTQVEGVENSRGVMLELSIATAMEKFVMTTDDKQGLVW